MMQDGWMYGMGPWHGVGALIMLLVIAALVKYVFFR
jgi:hypothetical protein